MNPTPVATATAKAMTPAIMQVMSKPSAVQVFLGLGRLSTDQTVIVEFGVALAAILFALASRLRRRIFTSTGFWLIAVGLLIDAGGTLSAKPEVAWVGIRFAAFELFFLGIFRLLFEALDAATSRGKPHVASILKDLSMVVGSVVVAAFGAVWVLKVDTSKVVISWGLVGGGVALALRETLSNILSGVTLQVRKPFEPGDWVSFGNESFGNQLGRVHGIRLRTTVAVTRTNDRLEIPNSLLVNQMIVNHTNGAVADQIEVGLSYDEPPNRVRDVVLRVLHDMPAVLSEPEPQVLAWEYGDYAIRYRVRYWLSDYDGQERVRDAVVTSLWYALRRNAIEIPYPSRTLYTRAAIGGEEAARESERRLMGELRQVDFLRQLDDEEIKLMLPAVRIRQFGPGETLMREDEVGETFYIMRRGTVEVTRSKNGTLVHLATVTPDSKVPFVGESSPLTGDPRTATVRASTDVEVLEMNRQGFTDLFRKHPELADQMGEIIDRRLRERTEQLERVPTTELDRSRRRQMVDRIRRFFNL